MLKRLYKSWRDMDLYMLGLLEKPQVKRGRRVSVTGPTHSCEFDSNYRQVFFSKRET